MRCDGVTYNNACQHLLRRGHRIHHANGGDCIDESLIDPFAICPLIYEPVWVRWHHLRKRLRAKLRGCDKYHTGSGEAKGTPILEVWPSDVPGVWNFMVFDVSNPTGGPLSVNAIEWATNGVVVEGAEDGITHGVLGH